MNEELLIWTTSSDRNSINHQESLDKICNTSCVHLIWDKSADYYGSRDIHRQISVTVNRVEASAMVY